MADGDKVFTITFSTEAELAGAEQLLASLEKQIGAAKALGEEYGEEQAKADRVRAAIEGQSAAHGEAAGSADDLSKAVEAAGKKTEEAGTHHAALTQLVKGLKHEFPLLAQATRAMINPYTAIATVVALATRAFAQYVQETNAASEESTVSEMLNAQLASMRELTASFGREAGQFKQHLAGMAGGAQGAATAMENLNKRIEASIALQDRLKDAKSALEKAQIQGRMDRREITNEEGLIQIQAVVERRKREGAASEIAAAAREFEQAKAAVAAAQAEKTRAAGLMPSPQALAAATHGMAASGTDESKKEAAKLQEQEAALRNYIKDIAAGRAVFTQGGQAQIPGTSMSIPTPAGMFPGLSWLPKFLTTGKLAGAGDFDAAEKAAQEQLDVILAQQAQQKTLADSAALKLKTLTDRQTAAKSAQEAAEKNYQDLLARRDQAKALYEDTKRLVAEIYVAETSAERLAAQAQVTAAGEATSAEINAALQARTQTGMPISARTQRTMQARTREAIDNGLETNTTNAVLDSARAMRQQLNVMFLQIIQEQQQTRRDLQALQSRAAVAQ